MGGGASGYKNFWKICTGYQITALFRLQGYGSQSAPAHTRVNYVYTKIGPAPHQMASPIRVKRLK